MYWVSPDGRVRDVEMLRSSKPEDSRWVNPIIDALGKRRYAPFASEPFDPGRLQIERYSLVVYPIFSPVSRVVFYDIRLAILDLNELPAPAPAP